MPTISDNRKARHDFFIDDKFEAGISLLGWEVKSARASTVNLQDSYVYLAEGSGVKGVTPLLKNAFFSCYNFGDVKLQENRRDRQLLLNKHEIKKIYTAVKQKGFTCVPTKIYFNERGRVKIEIALARGKHNFDKRQALKERDIMRENVGMLS